MSSTRLPGKVLKPLFGRPMLAWQMDRIKAARLIDLAIVATSNTASDDPVAALCASKGVPCFRGPLDDVLARVEGAAEAFGPFDHIVRLTGDCPLTDPGIVDACIALHLANGCDYTSNGVQRSYPDGLDVEVVAREALRRAARQANQAHDREHVTPFIYNNPGLFTAQPVLYPQNLAALRWTVDLPADFLFVEKVFSELVPKKELFGWRDVLQLIRANPEIAAINS